MSKKQYINEYVLNNLPEGYDPYIHGVFVNVHIMSNGNVRTGGRQNRYDIPNGGYFESKVFIVDKEWYDAPFWSMSKVDKHNFTVKVYGMEIRMSPTVRGNKKYVSVLADIIYTDKVTHYAGILKGKRLEITAYPSQGVGFVLWTPITTDITAVLMTPEEAEKEVREKIKFAYTYLTINEDVDKYRDKEIMESYEKVDYFK